MKGRIFSIIFMFGILFTQSSFAQEQWWSYISEQENGPSSTRVDLSLKKLAPIKGYPFVAVTGIKYKSKNTKGLPSSSKLDYLNNIQEELVGYIEKKIPIKYVGTFTYQNEQLHYLYIKEKGNIKQELKKFYSKYCKGCEPYINIKSDPNWLGYVNFLYPSKEIMEFYGLSVNN